jgi:predicted unusual protein kinase regulating ubiquinone biosynthesis (AarF/ABC1/UbiB family)
MYQSMSAFRARMLSQIDFIEEANNLLRFRKNFHNSEFKGKVHFPLVVFPVAHSVLLMSFEEGHTIRRFLKVIVC